MPRSWEEVLLTEVYVVACHASICCRLLLGCAAISEPRSYRCKAGSPLTVAATLPVPATLAPSREPTRLSPFPSPSSSPAVPALGDGSSEPCPKRRRRGERSDECNEVAEAISSPDDFEHVLSELMHSPEKEDEEDLEVQPLDGGEMQQMAENGETVASDADGSLVAKHEYGNVILQDDTLLVVKTTKRKTFPKNTRLLTCLKGSFGFKDGGDEDDPVLSLTFTKYTKVCLKRPDAQILEEEESTIGHLMKKHDVVLVEGHTVSKTGGLSQSCPNEKDRMHAHDMFQTVELQILKCFWNVEMAEAATRI